ncbi:MAG TPA: type II secretion system F family protein, partial [Nitrososphaerales archaeon]|nr:type II secretion system F family protein [Nitrososphaerales archaeon]
MSQQVFDRFYPVAPSLGSFDKFSLVSYRIFKGPATRIARSMPLLRDDLLRSNLRFTPVGLVSVALFATLISGLASLGVIVWASRTPYSFLYLVALVPPGVYLTTMNAPKISKSGRAASLENELPFVLGYMSILAGGGLSLIDSLREIANLDIFSSASKEAKRILIDIDVFGHDPVTALDRAAKYSPSREWGDLLAGYTTVLRTGGDHINFLALHLKETFEKMTEKLKRTVDTTGLVAESFLIVTVVLGMVLFTLYLVEAIINNNPGGLSNIIFFSYLVVPALSAVFIWLMDVFAPKWP